MHGSFQIPISFISYKKHYLIKITCLNVYYLLLKFSPSYVKRPVYIFKTISDSPYNRFAKLHSSFIYEVQQKMCWLNGNKNRYFDYRSFFKNYIDLFVHLPFIEDRYNTLENLPCISFCCSFNTRIIPIAGKKNDLYQKKMFNYIRDIY